MPASSGSDLGFTLVEIAVVLAVAAILLTLTMPTTLSYIAQARRSDAVAALTRLQVAQEHYRAQHGLYAVDRRVLRGASAARSDGGWYDIALDEARPDTYQASAAARADGPQAVDHGCTLITLRVADGIAEHGPSPRCWNR